ncbi:M48 family metalloprotease [Porticoccus sp. W117]|uniref:M48 family metalloprotease n=1 Tax=Porticoccus sp. W117 TaxID=3054777 RepID=UPI002596C75A|nr:M48 family metallopeptidase [Porticoccus sp. W117]MDM3871646.1 M48 family metalloprotease [Porticoccus sp. W117]
MTIKTEEQFIAVVQKAEKDSARNINSYKTRLALFAVLGYVVIFTILLLLLGMVGGMVALAFVSSSLLFLLIKKKIIFVVIFAIWTFFKALWVKFDRPEGYELARKDYPKLFAEIDNLTKSLKALKIHRVILTEELNAGVVQHPKYGILGGQQNILFLGLELLLALSPQEMRSVLAHEFGHLSGNHSRFSGWIYRVRVSWDRVMHAFSGNGSFGASLMRRFFEWYSPYFSAYSFALARNNEYEADAISAELVSPPVAIKALVNVHALAPYIDEKFWSSYFKQADKVSEPPHKPYGGLASFLTSNPIQGDELADRVGKALEVETRYSDTHPSLHDRVKALGQEVLLPEISENNAAQEWLEELYEKTLEYFDARWMEANAGKWKDRYEYVKGAQKSLAEFANRETAALTDDELWDYASWSHEFIGEDEALPLYRAFQSRHKGSVGAAYYIGRILLTKKDDEGLEHLRIAFKSPDTISEAAHLGYQYLLDNNQNQAAEAWWKEAESANEIHQKAQAERDSASLKDKYVSPVIDQPLLEKMKQVLGAQKNVRSAWVAQKVVKYCQEQPVYIIAFKPKGFYFSDDKVLESLVQGFEGEGDIFLVAARGETKKLAKKVKKQGVNIL